MDSDIGGCQEARRAIAKLGRLEKHISNIATRAKKGVDQRELEKPRRICLQADRNASSRGSSERKMRKSAPVAFKKRK